MDSQLNQVFGNIDLDIKRAEPGKIEAGFPVVSGPSIESVAEQQQLGANLIRTANLPAIDTLRIVKKGITKVVITAVSQTDTHVTHNLGFVPIPFAFITSIQINANVFSTSFRTPWDFTGVAVLTGLVDIVRYTEVSDSTLSLKVFIPIATPFTDTLVYTVEWFLAEQTQAQ